MIMPRRHTSEVIYRKVGRFIYMVVMTDRITLPDYIYILCNKVSKSIEIMLRAKKNVDVNVLKMLYHSLIQPYFQYCNIIWATHHTQHIELLFRKQKKL